jgi:hypothetical protein
METQYNPALNTLPKRPKIVLFAGIISFVYGIALVAINRMVPEALWYGLAVIGLSAILIGMWIFDRKDAVLVEQTTGPNPKIISHVPGKWFLYSYIYALLTIVGLLIFTIYFFTKMR